MADKSLFEEIIDWIASLSYWEQYLAAKILAKEQITDKDINTAYKYFLEDSNLTKKKLLRPAIKLKTCSPIGPDQMEFKLKEIKGIKGVNALKEDQVIPLSDKLSIIYGDKLHVA